MSIITNGFKYAAFSYVLGLHETSKLSLTNAAVYGLGSGIIKSSIGNGPIRTPLRVIGGIWLTKLMDPRHPMTFDNILRIKCAEVCFVVALFGIQCILTGIEAIGNRQEKEAKAAVLKLHLALDTSQLRKK